jgi:uncharacterized membrane protein
MPKKGLGKLILTDYLEKTKTHRKEKTAAPAVAVFKVGVMGALMEEEKKENNQKDQEETLKEQKNQIQEIDLILKIHLMLLTETLWSQCTNK